ncbi:S8 family serine peptidase [Bacillus sp. FJAT-45350]|uniref:S8 family serine peptidase n=1 Tax=Bacillus sp. FJAT-45350 TaxID=2011014 RepID=UPI000BB79E17|nr:S8 family serine peptidase [Bacillus sp. FJAT-45350]
MSALKKLLLLTLVVVFVMLTPYSQVVQANQFPSRPPVQNDEEEKEAVVIVKVEEERIEDVLQDIKDKFPSTKVRKRFNLLFSGFSIQVLEKDIKAIEAITGIERVDRVVTYQAMINDSVPFIGGDEIRRQYDRNGDHLTGKGIKVAVIDTGIDYKHPDLKENYKGGFDVVDCDEDPMETLESQGAPTLHGTHVAGIIAANGQIKGVAPEAELYAYRALGPGGQGTTEQVIEAIEKAVEDGVDVINLSLGNTVNGPDWPTSIALDKAVDLGVVAVTSNGNSGPKMWTVGSPGTSTNAISVGASLPPLKIPYLTVFGENKEIEQNGIGGGLPWTIKRDYPIISAGLGMKSDFDDKNAEGKIVIVKRGIIPFIEKAQNAKEAGAKGLIIYNNTSGSFAGALEGGVELPIVSISKEDGEWIVDKIADDRKDEETLRTLYKDEEDFLAPFSSRGPVTHTWEVKPDVVAPGVSIDSTIPKGYLGLNGTSMAAPHVAGAAALIKQAHPDWSPLQIKAALMNSAKGLADRDGNAYYPYEQGAGRIQVDKAVEMDTLVYPGAVTFGKWSKDDRREVKEVTLTIDNQSPKENTYYVVPPIDAPDGIQWKVPFSFTLEPNETKDVTVVMDIMPSVLKEGVHSGDIFVKGGNEDIRVPYQFFIEEPDYPRLMAFMFEHADYPGAYRYEMYLPGGAEEVGIAIYDPDTFEFLRYLDVKKNVERGIVEGEIAADSLRDGVYKALVFANKDGQEDTIETTIIIGDNEYHKPNNIQ